MENDQIGIYDGIRFEDVALRTEVSSRGGGIEIALDKFGEPGEKMAAYQNYLGGGMLGRVMVNDTIRAKHKIVELSLSQKLDEIGEALKKYYHSLTNPDGEWEGTTYEQNQSLPGSAY